MGDDLLKKQIKRLPKDIQPLAERYVNTIIDASVDELTAFLGDFTKGNWAEAYKFVAKNMSTDDILKEQERINNKLLKLNRKNANYLRLQKEIAKEALTVGVLLLKAKAGV